jgi:hypothetical protein
MHATAMVLDGIDRPVFLTENSGPPIAAAPVPKTTIA